MLQVTGELSNRGEPMRRFMQTFVLAAQSQKKYFVQNDIFRYQDEVFEDDTSDSEDTSGVHPLAQALGARHRVLPQLPSHLQDYLTCRSMCVVRNSRQ